MKFKFTKDWKHFERVVAAIHSAEMAGANVLLNEKIKGREFDVSIRFKNGPHSYLTLIECKKYSNPIPVEKVEAFITKSSDAGANKSIMFSSSGFQSGAITAATRHGIDLYTVYGKIKIPDEIKAGGETEALNVRDIIFTIGGSDYHFPLEDGKMEYHAKKSFLTHGAEKVTVNEFLEARSHELFKLSSDTEKEKVYNQPPGVRLTAPNMIENGEVQKITICYKKMKLVNLKPGTPVMDHHLFEKMVTYYCMKNEVTGEESTIMALSVHLGFDTKIQKGKFYSNPNLGNSYYIESIKDGIAKIYLLESYSMGNLVQAVYMQSIKYQYQFVLISDLREVSRLSKLYSKMKEKER